MQWGAFKHQRKDKGLLENLSSQLFLFPKNIRLRLAFQAWSKPA